MEDNMETPNDPTNVYSLPFDHFWDIFIMCLHQGSEKSQNGDRKTVGARGQGGSGK